MTQMSSTSSSLYPASTSVGTRTDSSILYTDDQNDADVSYPEIVTPEHPDFDPDDVSYRLRLLLNNSYFLPPAHAKPSPLSLSTSATDASKKSKPSNGGFLNFFGIGKAKAKPTRQGSRKRQDEVLGEGEVIVKRRMFSGSKGTGATPATRRGRRPAAESIDKYYSGSL